MQITITDKGLVAQANVETYLNNPTSINYERAVQSYDLLVKRIANAYAAHAELDDLIAEGYRGLVEALRKYDPSTGNVFSTYAAHYIRGKIRHYLTRRTQPIHVPSWILEFYQKREAAFRHLQSKGLPITDDAVAECMGIEVALYARRLKECPLYTYTGLTQHTSEDDKENEVAHCNMVADLYGRSQSNSVKEMFFEQFHFCQGHTVEKIKFLLECSFEQAQEVHALLNA